ncbi:MAG TPA: DUF948 domain-containing protein, partial [Smithellaceae bacterium]|nr:DUF948 domain-containing protein [Smithellaceae bacterium]
ALLLLVLFCIPILLKLWRAASDVTISLQALNQRLPMILKNMEDISTNINNSTTAINEEVQKYKETSERFHNVMDHVVNGISILSPFAVKSPVLRIMTNGVAMLKGLRVFLNVLKGKQ